MDVGIDQDAGSGRRLGPSVVRPCGGRVGAPVSADDHRAFDAGLDEHQQVSGAEAGPSRVVVNQDKP